MLQPVEMVQLFKIEYRYYGKESYYAHHWYTLREAENFIKSYNALSHDSMARIAFQYTKNEALDWCNEEIKRLMQSGTMKSLETAHRLMTQYTLAY